MQFGPSISGAGSAHAIAQRELARTTRRVALAEAGGDHDERARAGLERRVDGVLERRARAPPRRRGRPRPRARAARRAAAAEQLAAARVDQVHGAPVGALERGLGEPVAPRLRVGRGSGDGDRARREERLEVAPVVTLRPAPDRAQMIRRWMSDVPSQISSSFASRNHFSTGYSRE